MDQAIAEDVVFAAGIFKDCFGKGGDFTVVVEEPEGGEGGMASVQSSRCGLRCYPVGPSSLTRC